jgi:hypothetical protein
MTMSQPHPTQPLPPNLKHRRRRSAGRHANDENQTFLEEINPGNQVKGTLVFDIPKKSKPDKLLLKAGVLGFSEGVIVNVS